MGIGYWVINVMKTFILIAGLIFARGLPAQHSPPDTTVVKKEITKKQKENRHNAIHAGAIVMTFVLYMTWFIRHESK
jgi:hypothetical protein